MSDWMSEREIAQLAGLVVMRCSVMADTALVEDWPRDVVVLLAALDAAARRALHAPDADWQRLSAGFLRDLSVAGN